MNPTSESFDQPTQVSKTGGKKMSRNQKATIFAGLGGAAALAGGSALAWGMTQDGKANENHPTTESKPATDAKPSTETPADSTHVTTHPQPEVTPSKTDANETPDSTEPMVATHVTDAMSFEDAFKTARQEVGPGGYFEWNGHLYNTYYKEEWDALSTKEREEYAATVYGDETPATDSNSGSSYASNASNDSSKADIRVGEVDGHTVALGDADHDGDSEVMVIDGTVGAIDKDNDGVMETRVELDPTTHEIVSEAPLASTFTAPQMSELGAPESQPTVANNNNSNSETDLYVIESDGHSAVVGDTDHDGDAEIILIDGTVGIIDTNNDGVMDTEVQIDPNTNEVVAQAPLKETFAAPSLTDSDETQNQPSLASNETASEVEVVSASYEGQTVSMIDLNEDGYVDVMVNEQGVGLVDTDGNHQFDTAVQFDAQTGEVVATAHLEHEFAAPTLDSFTQNEENLASNTDYDNNADVSDWVA